MRRISIIGLIIAGLVAMPLIVAAAPGGEGKVAVCHIPDDGGAPHEIVVNAKALKAHQNHGDIEGACPDEEPTNTAPTAVIGFSTIWCSFGGTCEMELDGTGSSDPESDPLTYVWTVNAVQVSTDASFTFQGARGEYGITLTVSDGSLTDMASGFYTP